LECCGHATALGPKAAAWPQHSEGLRQAFVHLGREIMMIRLVVLSFFLGVPTLAAKDVGEIVEKSLAALGGADKLRSMESRLLVGDALLGGGIVSGEFRWLTQRPNHHKIEIIVGDQSIVQAYDGTAAWQIQPVQFGGTGQAEVLEGQAAESVKQSATFESALVDYQQKGHKPELLDEAEVRGKPAYRIRLTLASGRINDYFIDQQSYLPVKTLTTTFNPQTEEEVEVESHSGNYKEVNGLQVPHTLETFAGGQVINEFQVTEARINLTASVKDFRPPSR